MRIIPWIIAAAFSLAPLAALAQGTLPVALAQQVDLNGKPLAGALLYTYQVGTVATPQNTYSDSGLTFLNPWPLSADQSGRIPMFYMGAGSTSVRLTDRFGVVQFSYPSMLVIGASSGSGSGGTVDPTTVFTTGDVKYRPTGDTVTGWVKMNGQTIGSATSGSSGRANADTQALFVYLWGVCSDTFCPVLTGRGASGLADFNANKQLTVPDFRGRTPVGLDDMGSTAASRLTGALFATGNATTAFSVGGEATHVQTPSEMAQHHHAIPMEGKSVSTLPQAWSDATLASQGPAGGSVSSDLNTRDTGSSTAFNVMNPFVLGSWYLKL